MNKTYRRVIKINKFNNNKNKRIMKIYLQRIKFNNNNNYNNSKLNKNPQHKNQAHFLFNQLQKNELFLLLLFIMHKVIKIKYKYSIYIIFFEMFCK